MNKQPEVRAQTRQKLTHAFWTLCEEKNLQQITVGELTRLAGCNRSTFYEYFTDMPDLIGQVEEKITAALPFLKEQDTARSTAMFQLFFDAMNEPVYCLLGPHGDPAFAARVRKLILPVFASALRFHPDEERFGYITAFAYSAVIGYLQYWHEQGRSMPQESFVQLGCELVTTGLLGTLSRENLLPSLPSGPVIS